jgi:hypothetical protein
VRTSLIVIPCPVTHAYLDLSEGDRKEMLAARDALNAGIAKLEETVGWHMECVRNGAFFGGYSGVARAMIQDIAAGLLLADWVSDNPEGYSARLADGLRNAGDAVLGHARTHSQRHRRAHARAVPGAEPASGGLLIDRHPAVRFTVPGVDASPLVGRLA